MIMRLRRLRNRLVWWLEELGQSGMEPSHRPGHRFYRPGPDEEVRNDEWRKVKLRRDRDDTRRDHG
jgi:hypothetical protein